MAYTIQAILGPSAVLRRVGVPGSALALLEGDLAMFPLGGRTQERIGLPSLPLTEVGSSELPENFTQFCSAIAHAGAIAYVEARFSGSGGTQAAVFFARDGRRERPVLGEGAINGALARLGVRRSEGQDEFASVGLGRHDHTEDWLRSP